jgi:hypothetical protein
MKFRSVPGAPAPGRERARLGLRLDVVGVATVEGLGRGVRDRLGPGCEHDALGTLGVGRELQQLRGLVVQGHRLDEVRLRVDDVQDELLGEPLAPDQRRLVDLLQGLRARSWRSRGVGGRLRERLESAGAPGFSATKVRRPSGGR